MLLFNPPEEESLVCVVLVTLHADDAELRMSSTQLYKSSDQISP